MSTTPAPPQITLQPKKLFLALPEAPRWNEFAASDAFGKAATYAFAEFAWDKRAVDTGTAAANALKVEGAKEFLAVLLTIGSIRETKPKEEHFPRLNPDPDFKTAVKQPAKTP